MYESIKHIIPQEYRRRSIAVAVAILLRAVLNFFGIAMLVPLLAIILDGENIASYPIIGDVYNMLDNATQAKFAFVVAGGVVVFMILKSVISLALYRYERDYVY